MIRKAPNINHLWAQLLVEELIRCGITHFFIAPGSRSTPLVTAVALNEKAQAYVHFDERGSAFAALGCARATGQPAAWITTSGTAVANGLPAIVEASIDQVPLLAITADRPPELRKTSANQTIDQPNIFGAYAQWTFDLPVPTTAISPRALLTTIDQAVHRCKSNGPVHVNAMFREPLAPEPADEKFNSYLSPLNNWLDAKEPLTSYDTVAKTPAKGTFDKLSAIISGAQRGLIIAGRILNREAGEAVQALASQLGWPLFADIGSEIATAIESDSRIRYFDLLLSETKPADQPDVVIQFGKRSVSKKLQQWIEQSPFEHYVLADPYPGRIDPLHQVTLRIETEIASLCKKLLERSGNEKKPNQRWLQLWKQQDELAASVIENYFEGNAELSEPAIARTMMAQLQKDDLLFAGNSMPIRDVDVFSGNQDELPHVYMNRGASGIDGTIATCAGVIIGRQKPITVLLGDLSLLHDLNSLAWCKQLPYPMIIVVINNDGGGIFSFLPISSYEAVFETYFATPHGLNFEAAAKMFSLTYEQPADLVSFKLAYKNALLHSSPTLIEVRTDRTQNKAVHKAIRQSLMDAR